MSTERSKPTTEKAAKGPQFVFIGDPNDNYSGPPAITVKGVRFVRNRPSDVPESLVKFFNGHNHFQTPEKAEKTMKRLAEADQRRMRQLDEEGDEDDDHGGRTAPRRTVATVRKEGDGASSTDYDTMSMAQLHMAVAEAGKSAKGDATKEELVAVLKGD